MSDSHRLQNDHKPLSDAAAQRSETRKKALALAKASRHAVDTAREKHARTHQILEKTRQLITKTEETTQHTQAWRERRAELGEPSPATTFQTVVNILIIEDSPADVTLFRYALKVAALPCQLTVLTQHCELEAFVRQATTSASLFPPRLIIADCMIPGMEVEELVTAVRTVPAYQSTPVILFSSLPEEEGERLKKQCGATAFVHKPGKLEDFVTTVSTMVHRWGRVGDGLDTASEQEEST